ncbi:hypothetical protein RSAG8_10683, partial [Rhizoctonia solani AG-8 WAC10335]
MSALSSVGQKRRLSNDHPAVSPPLKRHGQPSSKEVDGQRYAERIVRKALRNKKILPFRIEDLQANIDHNKVKVTGQSFRPTLGTETVLRAEDGPQLVVDLNDDIVMFYCPGYVTEVSSGHLLRCLEDVVKANPPVPDKPTGDKRGHNFTAAKKLSHRSVIQGLNDLAPCAYYLAPAWYGTGQENSVDQSPDSSLSRYDSSPTGS